MDHIWRANTAALKACLDQLSVWNAAGQSLEQDAAFGHLQETSLAMRQAGQTFYFVGNGASASMASHVSADLAKNAHLKTKTFTDLSLITAVANDICYEEVFAEPLKRWMVKGDMLVAISSSGRSPNVLRAAEAAQALGGCVVTLSAMKPDNPLRTLGTWNFYIPADTYGLAETGHAAILHFWVDQMVAATTTTPKG